MHGRYTPQLAARWLPSIPPQQGREELKGQDAALRHHVLLALQPKDAAVLLEVSLIYVKTNTPWPFHSCWKQVLHADMACRRAVARRRL